MIKKKNFFLWAFIFIILTTYSINSTHKKQNSFLPIKFIQIDGTLNSNKLEIRNKLNELKGRNIIFVGHNKFKELVGKVDFVKEIKVKKIYPDTIKVTVTEFKPIGLFVDKNNIKFLLTDEGKIITNYESNKFESLPLVYGEESKKKFHIFYKSLENIGFETNLIKKLNYFDINRWDIILKNGKVIKLPTTKYENSLKKFLTIFNKIEFSDFQVFDFRIKGELILR